MRVEQHVLITLLLARLRAASKRGERRCNARQEQDQQSDGKALGKGVGQGRTTGGMGMWFTSPRALHAAHVSLLTTSAAKAPAPGACAWYQVGWCTLKWCVACLPIAIVPRRPTSRFCEQTRTDFSTCHLSPALLHAYCGDYSIQIQEEGTTHYCCMPESDPCSYEQADAPEKPAL